MEIIKLCLFVQGLEIFTHFLDVPGLIVFLEIENLIDFDLSPYEVSFIIFICKAPPLISSFE